jgi:flagellar hook-associated protein 2
MSLAAGVGLVSGIDFNAIISSLRQVNSRPISLIANKQRLIETQRSSLQKINRALVTFKSTTEELSSREAFLAMSGSTTDASVVRATASNTATAGS